MKVVGSGQSLTAPGVLRNAVAIEALYDREEGARSVLRAALGAWAWSLSPAQSSRRLDACHDLAQLTAWTVRVITASTVDDVFA